MLRVLVLGAGFGGLELTTRLSDELGDEAEIVLIDQSDGFVFGFSKLDVMFGRTTAESVVHPYGALVKPGSPAASQALLVEFARRGVSWHPERLVRGLDPERRVALLSDGDGMAYDLFLGEPVHRAPAVVQQAGMCVDDRIPVNPLTLETAYPGAYAIGDVISIGTPKAGAFAEGQAMVVAERIVAQHRGAVSSSNYGGRGICYVEFGDEKVGRVDVTFRSGERPTGQFDEPSELYLADKSEFGRSRIRRWFGRDWTSY